MLNKNVQQANRLGFRGFTIIEVMIVLTIAALILLIVFLAVPALQRNNRNTQRRSDVGRMLAAANEYSANNNCTYPASGQFDTQFGTVAPSLAIYVYGATTTTWSYSASAIAAPAAVTASDTVKLYNYLKCNGNAPTAAGASARSIVALYAVESGGGNTVAQCVES